ncbi:hypothetical protein DdX_11046 [Ditylenchus destructor]|uniref:Uncharacterized protein n=1 Tax=Ditylenchus destructor TaxID=166010 RepID=A0AAD4MXB4_9BILA|nr:hypothetical protein DdX_11046 [Ditylenchus destructor]
MPLSYIICYSIALSLFSFHTLAAPAQKTDSSDPSLNSASGDLDSRASKSPNEEPLVVFQLSDNALTNSPTASFLDPSWFSRAQQPSVFFDVDPQTDRNPETLDYSSLPGPSLPLLFRPNTKASQIDNRNEQRKFKRGFQYYGARGRRTPSDSFEADFMRNARPFASRFNYLPSRGRK